MFKQHQANVLGEYFILTRTETTAKICSGKNIPTMNNTVNGEKLEQCFQSFAYNSKQWQKRNRNQQVNRTGHTYIQQPEKILYNTLQL